MWGAWASSLAYGYTYGVVLIMANPEEVDAQEGRRRPGLILAMTAFFSFHFLLFHAWQGTVLNMVFRINESFFLFPGTAFASYWLVVAATFASRAPELWSATRPSDDPHRLLKPYVNIVRMQVLVFVFLFLESVGMIRFAVYPVLVFYFFPFPIIKEKIKEWFDRLDERMNTPPPFE